MNVDGLNILFMRNIKITLGVFLLSFLFIISCKSKQQSFNRKMLPAYHEDSNSGVFKSIINSSNYAKYQKLMINDKEYPLNDLQKILDTLKDYKIIIKRDTISNKKLIIIKSS
jgi:hypothetical protein